MAIEFSIITPVFNAMPYLHACIESLLCQSFGDFELILIDDGSTDGSGSVCDDYAARDTRIRVIHKPNGGVVAARRTGLGAAKADYICFVDADDYMADTWLAALWEGVCLGQRPDVLLFGYINDYGDAREEKPPLLDPGLYDGDALARDIWPRMLYDGGRPFFSKLLQGFSCTKAFRRELIAAHYIEDDRIRILEDTCTVFECIRCARSMYVVPGCYYYYRIRAGSSIHSYNEDYFRQLRLCFDYLRSHLGGFAPDMRPAIDAYMANQLIEAIAQEFAYGDRSVAQAARHVRTELNRTKLAADIGSRGLPAHIRAFLLLLKLRLYYPAALATKLRM